MRFHRPGLLAIPVALLLGIAPARAGLVLATSTSALGANDVIDWSQLGPDPTILTSPQNVVSGDGLDAVVSSSGGVFMRVDEGHGWTGNFAPGTPLLWTAGHGPEFVITFASPVFGAGARIQSNSFGAFTAEIVASDGGVLGSFTQDGQSNPNEDNSAIFIGALSDVANIASIRFDLVSAVSAGNDFAIGPLALNTLGLRLPIPEPGSLLLLGVALTGFAGWRRSRNRSPRAGVA